LLQVGYDIVTVLYAYTQSDEVRTNTRFEQLLIAELTMGM
jgi:hypothetical protein